MNKPIVFKVFSLYNEISLNRLAQHFGIKKKFEWEDFLRLRDKQLSGILKEPEDKAVVLFPFGSVVFINMEHHEIVDLIKYLREIDPTLPEPSFQYSDDYQLEVTGDEEETVDNDAMRVTSYADYQTVILSIVLAKSVALEKVEYDIEILLDEIELLINRLQNGNLSAREHSVALISGRILRFKYNTLSYIMLLDKPDITWNNQGAEELYTNLAHLFELFDRYEKVQAKTNALTDILQMFTDLTQHRKANTLEWMIIILILIEIFISLVEFFKIHL